MERVKNDYIREQWENRKIKHHSIRKEKVKEYNIKITCEYTCMKWKQEEKGKDW